MQKEGRSDRSVILWVHNMILRAQYNRICSCVQNYCRSVASNCSLYSVLCMPPTMGCCSFMCACQSSLLSISICKYFEKLHPYAEMSAVNRRQFPAFQVRWSEHGCIMTHKLFTFLCPSLCSIIWYQSEGGYAVSWERSHSSLYTHTPI